MILFNFKKYIFESKEKVGRKILMTTPPYLKSNPEFIIWFQSRDLENKLHSFNNKPAYFGYYGKEPNTLEHVRYYRRGLDITFQK